MCLKVALLPKAYVALHASVGLLTAMDAHMNSEIVRDGESSRTLGALERFFTAVVSLLHCDGGFGHEFCRTLAARETFLSTFAVGGRG